MTNENSILLLFYPIKYLQLFQRWWSVLSCLLSSRLMHTYVYVCVPARSRPVSYIQLSNGTRRKRKKRKIKKKKREERKKERKTLCSHIWLGLHWDRTEKDRMMTTNKLCILFSLAFVRRKWLMMLVGNIWCFLFVVVSVFFSMIILLSFLVDHFTKENHRRVWINGRLNEEKN
jgi:hypothetical protein